MLRRAGCLLSKGLGKVVTNSSPLSLLTVLKPGGSSNAQLDSKPPLTVDQMIELMVDRGLEVTNEPALRKSLYDCNYYRLSGYFRVFQKDPSNGDNQFKLGTRDADFLVPYEMDERLRSIILRGTALVELTLRSRFAHLLAVNGGAYTYMEPSSYQDRKDSKGQTMRDGLLRNMNKWLGMSSEVCIRHYTRTKRPIPVWAAVEVFPFDTFSKMLSLHSDTASLKKLYRSVGLRTSLRTSSEIVHAMVYLRNLCSHHSRLWHREMVIPSPTIRDVNSAYPDFVYQAKSVASSLIVLMYLVTHIDGCDTYHQEISSFLCENDAYAAGIATPLHWE